MYFQPGQYILRVTQNLDLKGWLSIKTIEMKPIHPKKVLFKIVNDHVRVHVRGYKKIVVRSDPVWLCVSTDLWFIVITVSDS